MSTPTTTGRRQYRITHRSTYSYEDQVTSSYGRGYLIPRELAGQTVSDATVTIEPEPTDRSWGVDVYGNTDTFFHVTTPHTELVVTGSSQVEVNAQDPALLTSAAAVAPWEDARPTLENGGARAREFVMDIVPPQACGPVEDYAAQILTPGRPLLEMVTDLTHRIYTDFTYKSKSTKTTTTVAELMETRTGVCQDFARVAIGCLRSRGLAARYVSGYLATTPPPGKARMVGADATHAWAAVWVPCPPDLVESRGGRWIAFDPTNDMLANEKHITVAVGRDYVDVPPLKGVIYTDSRSSKVAVSVDVAPLDEVSPADA